VDSPNERCRTNCAEQLLEEQRDHDADENREKHHNDGQDDENRYLRFGSQTEQRRTPNLPNTDGQLDTGKPLDENPVINLIESAQQV
jgi:hypothetical protein